jgi:acyl carrier protein
LADNAIDRDQLTEQILDLIAAEGMIDRANITPDATLDSLAVASVDVVMILMAIEEKFDVYVPIDGRIADSTDVQSFVNSLADRILESRG